MTNKSRNTTGKRSFIDANRTLTKDWTTLLDQAVENLPDCPEVRYLKSQYKSKFVSSETDPASVRRQRAINKWLATERNNEATNDRLLMTDPDFYILPDVTWSRFLEVTRNVIVSIIGEVVPEEALIGAFSGGASTSRKRTESYPASKYLGRADSTSASLDIWYESASCTPGWDKSALEINLVRGNVLFTVPKNATIDRCACKEPDINMFLQKGVGSVIRNRLRRCGVNLNDQERNKSLARIGSLTGSLATLDLSSASDSVTTSAVELLLPPLWFSHLNALRCDLTIIDGEEHRNEMFSSMGNGFTFELESLLFFSLARSCAYFEGIKGVISVYGDDIICPVELTDTLTWVLGWFGFEVNTDKSFSSGPFRESCGGHFYNGYDITPFYVRAPIQKMTDLIHLGNSIRRWSGRSEIGMLCPELEDFWSSIRDAVPKQLWGGRDLGSICQLVTPDLPRARLEPIRSKETLGEGAYYHWLNVTWDRSAVVEGIETSQLGKESAKYRIRPVRQYCRPLDTYFISEV